MISRRVCSPQSSDTWLAAITSLGFLGIIVHTKVEILADFKVYANQETVDEKDVLNGDIYAEISPYVTANYWVGCSCRRSLYSSAKWWPGKRHSSYNRFVIVSILISTGLRREKIP